VYADAALRNILWMQFSPKSGTLARPFASSGVKAVLRWCYNDITEISDLGTPIGVKENVSCLEVAMNNGLMVQPVKSTAHICVLQWCYSGVTVVLH
jgi:hypothetical protein